VGQEFDIVTGAVVRRGRITAIAPERVEFELEEEVTASTAAARITLLLAIFKFDRMEWAIEKCTELGVARIVPVIARRTDAHLASAAARRVERWRRVALQASEQSRRTVPCEVDLPVKLPQAAEVAGDLRILLSESEKQTRLQDILDSAEGTVVLAIGPEGGWTDDELQLFKNAGWTSASLGPTILRAETAAIAATAIIASALG